MDFIRIFIGFVFGGGGVKLTSNPNDPCVDCLFNHSTPCGCEDAKDFKFNLGNNRIVCAMYQSINGVTNKYGKDNEN